MSDDPTNSGWTSTEATGTTAQNEAAGGARAGFCQDCGRPLTPQTARAVGAAVFCEPCLGARVGAASPGSAYASVPPPAAMPDEPSPALAAILGFIPGVGAMYNGQFAKGVVHLIIFAVLVSLCDINGIFGLFIAGWIFYMVFEAYHTALARRDGLPLPNAFGFNDIGERMGFGRTWPTTNHAASPRPSTTSAAQSAAAPPSSGTGSAPTGSFTSASAATTNTTPVNPVPAGTTPDWVGYVPPTAFGTYTPPPNPAAAMASQIHAQAHTQAMRDAGYRSPYAETFTGAPSSGYAPTPSPAPSPDALTDPATGRFPMGALWLIGLGVLILLANLLPDWKLTERWWPPALFAGLALWIFTRRLRSGARTVCIIRWPVILMIVALMLALHAAYFTVTFGLTCSVLLIAFGALLLLERTAGANTVTAPLYAAPPVAPREFDPQAEEARTRTSWAASSTAASSSAAPPTHEAGDPKDSVGPKDGV